MVIDEIPLKAYFKTALEQFAPEHRVNLSSMAIDYLADTLTGFLRSEALFRRFEYGLLNKTYSLEPLTMLACSARNDGQQLRTLKAQLVGNECLFLVSFFYEYLWHKCGEGLLKYHGQLGSEAYHQAAQWSNNGQVFNELAGNFWNIADVVRNLDQAEPHRQILLKRHRQHLTGTAIEFN